MLSEVLLGDPRLALLTEALADVVLPSGSGAARRLSTRDDATTARRMVRQQTHDRAVRLTPGFSLNGALLLQGSIGPAHPSSFARATTYQDTHRWYVFTLDIGSRDVLGWSLMAQPQSEATRILGERVRDRRHALALSQEAMADQMVVPRTFLAQVERGQRNVMLHNLLKLAQGPTFVTERFPNTRGQILVKVLPVPRATVGTTVCVSLRPHVDRPKLLRVRE